MYHQMHARTHLPVTATQPPRQCTCARCTDCTGSGLSQACPSRQLLRCEVFRIMGFTCTVSILHHAGFCSRPRPFRHGLFFHRPEVRLVPGTANACTDPHQVSSCVNVAFVFFLSSLSLSSVERRSGGVDWCGAWLWSTCLRCAGVPGVMIPRSSHAAVCCLSVSVHGLSFGMGLFLRAVRTAVCVCIVLIF